MVYAIENDESHIYSQNLKFYSVLREVLRIFGFKFPRINHSKMDMDVRKEQNQDPKSDITNFSHLCLYQTLSIA